MKIHSLKSYIFSAIFFMSTILLSVFVIFGIVTVSQYIEQYQKEQEVQTKTYIKELTADISNIESYIRGVFSSNIQFEIMKRENTTEAEWMKAAYYLNNNLKVRSDAQSFYAGIFFYDSARDMLFSNFSMLPPSVQEYYINKAIKDEMRKNIVGSLRFRGTFEFEGETYILYAIGNKKTFLGFTICLSLYYSLPENMQLMAFDDQENLLFSKGAQLSEDIRRDFQKKEKEHFYKPIRYIYSEGMLSSENIRLVFIQENTYLILWKNKLFLALFLGIPLLCFLCMHSVYRFWIRTMYRPIDHVMSRLERMKRRQAGRESGGEAAGTAVPDEQFAEVRVINERLDEMIHEMKILEREKYRKEGEANAARLQYYQLQVQPHFYLNCLTILDSLLNDRNIDTVRQMIYLMSDHIRYSFKDSCSLVSVEEELEEVRAYVNLYMIRNAMPIFLKISVSEKDKKVQIPILSIQPFVENSIKYAHNTDQILSIEVKTEHVMIEQSAFLKISVSDNGEGFQEDKLEKLNRRVTEFQYHSTQVGVDNLKYRLNLIYGDTACLFMYNKPAGGAITEILIPEK